MRCFFCSSITQGIISTDLIPSTEVYHIFKVLRSKKNTNILLIDGLGTIAEAEILNKNELKVSSIKKLSPSLKNIHLFVAPPKKNSMDIILKQAAEIGLASVNLIQTEHSVAVHSKDSLPERMITLLKEGCKQAHNPFLPKLNPVISLNDFLNIKNDFDACFFGSTLKCSENFDSITINNPHKPNELHRANVANIAWIVGPEGGFSTQEESLLIENNISPVQIGRWVLRVETACLAGAVIFNS